MALRFLDRSTPRRYPHVAEGLLDCTQPGTTVLEVGCGGKQYGEFVRGTHLGLDRQSGLYPGKGADVIGSALHMPIANSSVDMIFMVATLLFMEEWHAPLRESCRALKPGGRLLIFDYKPRTAVRLGYPGRFTPDDLRNTLAIHGVTAKERTDLLPLNHVGPLRLDSLRRLLGRLVYPFGRWIVISGTKAAD
jgi:SAM-dependent methyltransferase